ncbi:MAG: hypothetical protein ACTSR8_08860 [Promethearchaeota archaeon]
MKNQKLIFIVMILFLMLPLPFVLGGREYSFQDRISDGVSVFFLVDLEEDEEIKVWVEPQDSGELALFLFDERPYESHVQMDRTLDDEIYDLAETYDEGKGNLEINYTAQKESIYYIQVVMVKNGPDFFILECNKELTRYYIPALPGFPIELFIFSTFCSIGIIIVFLRRKLE